MDKIILLLTDTHFGVRQNSMTWLNSQLEFMYEQFIPDLKHLKSVGHIPVHVVHMGDVFDSRSTISTYVATKVVEVFKEIASIAPVTIIAGNHDYYSPNSNEVDTLSLLLKDTGVRIVNKTILEEDGDAFIPWYEWGKPISDSIKRVFAHTDIVGESNAYPGKQVYSGHMHIPFINTNAQLFNIGSCYSLNFADANQERGYYIVKGDSSVFVPNKHSIKFWRLYNEDIFDVKKIDNINIRDYVELYISQSNMATREYVDKINELSDKYKNIWIIPQVDSAGEVDLEKFEGYDIEKITMDMIPDNLKPKFEQVLHSVNNSLL